MGKRGRWGKACPHQNLMDINESRGMGIPRRLIFPHIGSSYIQENMLVNYSFIHVGKWGRGYEERL